MQPAPVFGERSAAPPRALTRADDTAVLPAHAAIFAAARAEQEEGSRARVVPRSFRAALIAGLVIGCGLAGLDATQAGATLRALTGGVLTLDATPRLVPLVIVLGLYGGARAAATSLLVAHAALRRVGATSHAAYALGGGAVALAFALAAAARAQADVVDVSHLASHGLAIDVTAGIGAGFLNRVFAGARPA